MFPSDCFIISLPVVYSWIVEGNPSSRFEGWICGYHPFSIIFTPVVNMLLLLSWKGGRNIQKNYRHGFSCGRRINIYKKIKIYRGRRKGISIHCQAVPLQQLNRDPLFYQASWQQQHLPLRRNLEICLPLRRDTLLYQ